MRLNLRVATVVALAGLVVAACGTGGGGQQAPSGPKHGGTLRVAIGIDPDTLDPAAQTTTTSSQIVDMMAETLVTIDAKGAIQPLLATSWSQSSDGLSYTFTLRKDVTFQDGTPFNAQAVKFSIDRLLSPDTFKAQPNVLGGKTGISRVDVVDDTHVKFTLFTKLAPFVAALTQTQAAIISPASVNVAPNKPSVIARPVGTGPYKFSERVAGDHITMVANQSYWGPRSNYDTQIYKVVPEGASREALIRSGGADVIALPPANDIPALQADSSLRVILGPSDRTIQIIINTQDQAEPLLQKPEVRQALNYAVDKAAIIKNTMFGAATPLDAPMAKSLFGYCSIGTYDYNPTKAKQMLQQAGAAGMTVKLVSPTGRYVQDFQVAQAVAGYLSSAGLNVQGPSTTDWPTYVATYAQVGPAQAKTDLSLLGWAPPYLDAQQQFEQFYSPRVPPAGLESSYYKNPQVDALITEANAGTDATQRQQQYCQAAKTVWSDAPWIFLYNQKYPFVTTSAVKGVTGLPNEKFVTTWASPA
ncbi:MAG TPA: ABC transporter substrate-binding protein [Candidatus Dormibacteraeota bacterium]|nr:ABC transporter substrate-binding protein [Candidatus Dormibacteraeota bacterium]